MAGPVAARIIRRKIRTVQNVERLTAAMKMVAGARLRRMQEKVEAGRPYAEKMQALLGRAAGGAEGVQHPLLEVRDVRNLAVVVISSSRGLCGSYNSNVLRHAKQFIDETKQAKVYLITIGRKAREFFTRRGYVVSESYDALSGESPHPRIRVVAERLRTLFETRVVDKVVIIYTRFVSPIQHVAQALPFIPVERPPAAPLERRREEYIFEPPPKELFALLLPRYVDVLFYHLLMEATASEYGARMMAMTLATDNAEELIRGLTLSYHKSRQAAITKELLEVVGGAEALASD